MLLTTFCYIKIAQYGSQFTYYTQMISVYKYPEGKPISAIKSDHSSNSKSTDLGSSSTNNALTSSDSGATKTENINLKKRIAQVRDRS